MIKAGVSGPSKFKNAVSSARLRSPAETPQIKGGSPEVPAWKPPWMELDRSLPPRVTCGEGTTSPVRAARVPIVKVIDSTTDPVFFLVVRAFGIYLFTVSPTSFEDRRG